MHNDHNHDLDRLFTDLGESYRKDVRNAIKASLFVGFILGVGTGVIACLVASAL